MRMKRNDDDETRKNLARTIAESRAPAISRAAAILRLLGKSTQSLSLGQISRELGLVQSTCLYTLRALVAEEFVAFDPATKRYGLEAGVLTLARHWLRQNRFVDAAQPVLDEISGQFDVTTIGVQIVGLEHFVVVCVSRNETNFRLSAQVGSRFPALISATGRCVAAFGQHEVEPLRAGFDALRWDHPPDFASWMQQVEQTRQRGYALDIDQYISGVTVAAAPVQGATGVSHALVAVGLSSAMDRKGLDVIGGTLAAAAARLSREMTG